jgi:ABC-type multidrug transport system fused ATPase/permease subunit
MPFPRGPTKRDSYSAKGQAESAYPCMGIFQLPLSFILEKSPTSYFSSKTVMPIASGLERIFNNFCRYNQRSKKKSNRSKHSLPKKTTVYLLTGIWNHLSRRRRIQFGIILLIMLSSSVAELISIGTALPFLLVLNNPEKLWTDPVISKAAPMLSITELNHVVIIITFLFIAAAIAAALVRMLNLYTSTMFSAAVGSDLSCDGYFKTLSQPYSFHVAQNSSKMISEITLQTSRTVEAINSFLQLISSCAVAAGLILGLIIVDSTLTLSAMLLFGFIYFIMAITSRRELYRNSSEITLASSRQLKSLQEGLGSIRDIILDNSQSFYSDIYSKADRTQRKLQAKNIFLGFFPRYALEGVAMVAIAVLGLILTSQGNKESAVIPILGTFALGAQRLLPALQQIYSSWSSLKGYHWSISSVLNMLNQPIPTFVNNLAVTHEEFIQLKLESVSFSYKKYSKNVLDNIDLEIKSADIIGIIGTTGSGKSTLVDVIMGLLEPTHGMIFLNGHDLYNPSNKELLTHWKASIAHVPQNIYLCDSTIAENIALGIPLENIDMSKVIDSAKRARINSFIESTDKGYYTSVGERGISISGGQRQRIGIARAFYKNAKVLVFDEATSALDSETELSVIKSVNSLNKDVTIIMIAHRLSTLQKCERIIKLESGRIIADGPPQGTLYDKKLQK